MQRPDKYSSRAWDDPFWHVVRMVVDESRGRVLSEWEVQSLLETGTEAGRALYAYLTSHPAMLKEVAAYTQFRATVAADLLSRCRTEETAVADLAQLSAEVVKRYGTQSADHHQSPKVMVATVEVLTRDICHQSGLDVNVDPQKRAVQIADQGIWVSPRRLDGALPGLFNSVALWEIKEYWGGTAGGSKMSDAIYECQLVGQELRSFEAAHGTRVGHYVMLDGFHQWTARKSDLRRAVDLLCQGLLDELIVGSEVLTEWPRIVRQMCAIHLAR